MIIEPEWTLRFFAKEFMPTRRINVRQNQESLRLRRKAYLSCNEVSRKVEIFRTVVEHYMSLAHSVGVSWFVAQALSDQALPGFAQMRTELKRAATLKLR